MKKLLMVCATPKEMYFMENLVAENHLAAQIDLHQIGVGKTASAAVLSALLTKNDYRMVVNAGFAAAFGAFHPYDKVLITETRFWDAHLPAGVLSHLTQTYELSQPTDLLDLIDKTSVCLTGDSFCTESISSLDHYLVDMEVASMAWTCQYHHVPLVSLKVVSDILDNPTEGFEKYKERINNRHQNPFDFVGIFLTRILV